LGLSYGYGISMRIEEGLIYFGLTKSSHVFKAYQVSSEIIDDLLTGKAQIEDVRLESARSGTIFGVVSR
jgi:Zn-dependent M16 (insulinase) family peptidase